MQWFVKDRNPELRGRLRNMHATPQLSSNAAVFCRAHEPAYT